MKKRLKKVYHYFIHKHWKKSILVFLLLAILYWFSLPQPLFDSPTCMVLEDAQQNLLGAQIAADGQWRFPQQKQLPEKFVQAIIEFEDRRFFHHPGIDPIGIGRALVQNIRNGKVISGGSTLTMQVIRLSRRGKARTIFQKIIESILATRLELGYSKKEILALYASNAPFGGNVVGLDAASWRYYGKQPTLLSWAEAATLAVLPNSPALIHPGRNRQQLLEKRNRLLDRLYKKGLIDELSLELSKEESLPQKPLPLPRLTPHLLDRVYQKYFKKGKTTRWQSNINRAIQEQANRIIAKHQALLSNNGIHNAAAIIQEVETGKIIAYIGNVQGVGKAHSEAVDIIKAPRSTGSILKPFLYAAALQDGIIFPNSLISDIPSNMKGYKPENFHASYDGVISAKQALVRSLNVPFAHLLSDYGIEHFHFQLQQLGLTSITQIPQYYGLPLILGGAEGRLSEITNAYACMARTLNHFYKLDGQYYNTDFRKERYIASDTISAKKVVLKEAPKLSASAIYQTFEAMLKVERPDSDGNWERFQSSQRIAWKTGTSIGFRDAWAVGVTPKYTVGVWAGNADGEGRPGLVGVQAAAPILFELFDLLPSSDWFYPPYDEMEQFAVCQQSGYRALDICPKDTIWGIKAGTKVKACAYHQTVHLDSLAQFQVNSTCESPLNMQHESWFILPPVEEYYYRFKNPNYQTLPAFRADCVNTTTGQHNPMQLIYPRSTVKIYVPIDINGEMSSTIFKVAHRAPETLIYWHLDNQYLGKTATFHEFALNPNEGQHTLTLVDANGFRLERQFEILPREKNSDESRRE